MTSLSGSRRHLRQLAPIYDVTEPQVREYLLCKLQDAGL